jgi:hypothetical protein
MNVGRIDHGMDHPALGVDVDITLDPIVFFVS